MHDCGCQVLGGDAGGRRDDDRSRAHRKDPDADPLTAQIGMQPGPALPYWT